MASVWKSTFIFWKSCMNVCFSILTLLEQFFLYWYWSYFLLIKIWRSSFLHLQCRFGRCQLSEQALLWRGPTWCFYLWSFHRSCCHLYSWTSRHCSSQRQLGLSSLTTHSLSRFSHSRTSELEAGKALRRPCLQSGEWSHALDGHLFLRIWYR